LSRFDDGRGTAHSNGNPDRRGDAACRIAELSFQDAAKLRADHVDLLDLILIDLIRVPAFSSAWSFVRRPVPIFCGSCAILATKARHSAVGE
jgi:hypothetical protein